MTILTDDAIINYNNVESIYMADGKLCIDTVDATLHISNTPADAIQKIAVAISNSEVVVEIGGNIDINPITVENTDGLTDDSFGAEII